MLSKSDEGNLNGLGWVNCEVKKIKSDHHTAILPHMGWNSIKIKKKNILLDNLENKSFYFLHSFYCKCDKETVVTETFYYNHFCSIFVKDNIYGVQFHPEKSHSQGEKILENYYYANSTNNPSFINRK